MSSVGPGVALSLSALASVRAVLVGPGAIPALWWGLPWGEKRALTRLNLPQTPLISAMICCQCIVWALWKCRAKHKLRVDINSVRRRKDI